MKVLIVAFLFMAIFATGCYYDKHPVLIAAPPCDTTAIVTYSGTVKPILESICYACHSGSSPAGGQHLDAYGPVRALTINPPGKLIGVITHAPSFDPMPKNGGKLS